MNQFVLLVVSITLIPNMVFASADDDLDSVEECIKNIQVRDDEEYAKQLHSEECIKNIQVRNDEEYAEQLYSEECIKNIQVKDDEEYAHNVFLHEPNQAIQIKNDSEIANVLHQDQIEVLNSESRISVSSSLKQRRKMLMQESARYDTADVHHFNKNVVKPNIDFVTDVASELGLRSDIPFSVLEVKLKAVATDPVFNNALARLKAHPIQNVEGETGIILTSMFSCIADLADKIEGLGGEPYQYIAASFRENLQTNGGCFPGYAGRSFRDFLTLLNCYLSLRGGY